MNEIKHKEDDNQGMFYVEENNEIVGQATYTLQDDGIMVIDETMVEPKMEGKGIASKLIKHVVDYAKKNDIQVDPLCEFAAAQFKRHKEYQEVQVQ